MFSSRKEYKKLPVTDDPKQFVQDSPEGTRFRVNGTRGKVYVVRAKHAFDVSTGQMLV